MLKSRIIQKTEPSSLRVLAKKNNTINCHFVMTILFRQLCNCLFQDIYRCSVRNKYGV